MIRTLVVDDDFRVAHVHAASVDRVPGFGCLGEAHSADQARTMIAADPPDLMLLDLYLPDENGLSLLKSLHTQDVPAPDCIVITAARDLHSVREAMQLGAVYYLVKPFGFTQLSDQLLAYRRWREQIASAEQADQATVDALFDTLRAPTAASAARRRLPPTMRSILAVVQSSPTPLSASEIAEAVGISRATAQRHLTEMERKGVVVLSMEYGAAGRPVHRFSAASPPRS